LCTCLVSCFIKFYYNAVLESGLLPPHYIKKFIGYKFITLQPLYSKLIVS
jgi:hypothetical protein